jgi:hypothetical protein
MAGKPKIEDQEKPALEPELETLEPAAEDILEEIWAWELEPVDFEFEWGGRVWKGSADVKDPPASLFEMITLASEPVYTTRYRTKRDVKVIAAMIDFLSAVVLDWNYVDRRGMPIEISRESLASLPSALLGETFNAVASLFQSAPNT